MIYSSVLVLVCAISMVSSTSTQQEVREKVEEPQWKVGDCILGKKTILLILDSPNLYYFYFCDLTENYYSLNYYNMQLTDLTCHN